MQTQQQADERCWYCGVPVHAPMLAPNPYGSPNKFADIRTLRTTDHKIPRSQGGSNFGDNKVTACFSCNASKGSKTIEEYREYLFRVSPPGQAQAALCEAVAQNVLPPELADQLQVAINFIDMTFPVPVFWGEREESREGLSDMGPLFTQPSAATADPGA